MTQAKPISDAHLFDAHLDLAYLQRLGRDMNAQPVHAGGQDLPASVTLPSLKEGNVTHCLATIFTEPDAKGDPRVAYDPADPTAAHHVGVEQLNTYHQWSRDGLMHLPTSSLATNATIDAKAHLTAGILIENADPILDPQDLQWWHDRGVVAVGMAWWKDSRYAAGNGSTDPNAGITDLGTHLVKEIDRLNITHDASHLSQRATEHLLDLTDARIIASHSNCRALLGDRENPGWQRHIDDTTIKSIASRGGVIGLNLCQSFLTYPTTRDHRPSIAKTIDHVEHICDLTGSCDHIGLGTDMDGGFSALRLPEGINTPSDLTKLTDELAARGFNNTDIAAFGFNNWARLFPQLTNQLNA